MAKKVTIFREPKRRSWGGSRIPNGPRAQRNLVVNQVIEEAAGDWMPFCETEIEIEETPVFFSFSGISDHGYMIEEILAPEDMFPTMYFRTQK